MNKQITLGIILFLILVSGLWNSNLLEGLVTSPPKPKPPTPKEQIEVINTQLEEGLEIYKNRNSSSIGLQKLKHNLILILEQVILYTMSSPVLYSNTQVSSNDILAALQSDTVIKYITVYNGLRSMPFRRF